MAGWGRPERGEVLAHRTQEFVLLLTGAEILAEVKGINRGPGAERERTGDSNAFDLCDRHGTVACQRI